MKSVGEDITGSAISGNLKQKLQKFFLILHLGSSHNTACFKWKLLALTEKQGYFSSSQGGTDMLSSCKGSQKTNLHIICQALIVFRIEANTFFERTVIEESTEVENRSKLQSLLFIWVDSELIRQPHDYLYTEKMVGFDDFEQKRTMTSKQFRFRVSSSP